MLCELDVKKEGVKGEGGGGKRKTRRRKEKEGERERKRHATVADIQRILTRTGLK